MCFALIVLRNRDVPMLTASKRNKDELDSSPTLIQTSLTYECAHLLS